MPQKKTLDPKMKDDLVDLLIEVPATDERAGRTALLNGIPTNIRSGLNRADNAFVDFTNIINQLDPMGRLDNGERPLVIITHNAWRMTRGSELGRRLEKIEDGIEKAYGGDVPLLDLPDKPEILIFGGTGEWVNPAFMAKAQEAGRSVARLIIPRYEGGQQVEPVGGWGTGWLVSPQLLLTNWHVLHARDLSKEQPASEEDYRLQGLGITAWFDYHIEGQQPPGVQIEAVIGWNPQYDYALLRLRDHQQLQNRPYLSFPEKKSQIATGARLNIVQCPGGGPLKFAIRNNFYVGLGDFSYQLRYLTDTRSGSSGAPVLDDNWQVAAMHHGGREVDPQLMQGEPGLQKVVKFNNQGIAIHDILNDLPQAERSEIRHAQGWA